jgi:hypothetical protein
VIREWPVDGREDRCGLIRYLGIATLQDNGAWQCLAIVGDSLCRVEVRLTPDPNDAEYVAGLEAQGLA